MISYCGAQTPIITDFAQFSKLATSSLVLPPLPLMRKRSKLAFCHNTDQRARIGNQRPVCLSDVITEPRFTDEMDQDIRIEEIKVAHQLRRSRASKTSSSVSSPRIPEIISKTVFPAGIGSGSGDALNTRSRIAMISSGVRLFIFAIARLSESGSSSTSPSKPLTGESKPLSRIISSSNEPPSKAGSTLC